MEGYEYFARGHLITIFSAVRLPIFCRPWNSFCVFLHRLLIPTRSLPLTYYLNPLISLF
jgi:hypothetical protein